MNYVMAVSGGVDSVVLLDMLATKKLAITRNNPSQGLTFGERDKRTHPQGVTLNRDKKSDFSDKIVIAHFDHGIRPESAADARFVAALAKRYDLPFETKREELGSGASEALARERRYAFLREVAVRYDAEIITAHHLDDLVETIAVNLTRGTGWRGLAVLGDSSIHRPLLDRTKASLYEYATSYNLEWVEDETNQQNAYLRNRLRRRMQQNISLKVKQELARQRERQLDLAKKIDKEVEGLLTDSKSSTSRYFFTMIDESVAIELLRRLTKGQLTRPRLSALLMGIKTARPGATLELGEGVRAQFTQREFNCQI